MKLFPFFPKTFLQNFANMLKISTAKIYYFGIKVVVFKFLKVTQIF